MSLFWTSGLRGCFRDGVALPLLYLFCAVLAGCGGPDERTAAVVRAVDHFIRPTTAALRKSGADAEAAMTRLCDHPSAEGVTAARAAFQALVLAWSRAEIVDVGPVTVENRKERILFWPDRRSRGLKQIRAAIAGSDERVLLPSSLRSMSVAVQGIGALEYVLFGEDSETLEMEGGFRCRYGHAVATLLAQNFQATDEAWQAQDGFAHEWSSPSEQNPEFRTPEESLNELVSLMVRQIEQVNDVRLAGLAKMRAEDDDPETVIYWRSKTTAQSLKANLDAVHTLLNESGIRLLLPQEDQPLLDSIHIEFWKADDILAEMSASLSTLPASSDLAGQVAAVQQIGMNLRTLIGRHLAADLHVTAGFSSLDGD